MGFKEGIRKRMLWENMGQLTGTLVKKALEKTVVCNAKALAGEAVGNSTFQGKKNNNRYSLSYDHVPVIVSSIF